MINAASTNMMQTSMMQTVTFNNTFTDPFSGATHTIATTAQFDPATGQYNVMANAPAAHHTPPPAPTSIGQIMVGQFQGMAADVDGNGKDNYLDILSNGQVRLMDTGADGLAGTADDLAIDPRQYAQNLNNLPAWAKQAIGLPQHPPRPPHHNQYPDWMWKMMANMLRQCAQQNPYPNGFGGCQPQQGAGQGGCHPQGGGQGGCQPQHGGQGNNNCGPRQNPWNYAYGNGNLFQDYNNRRHDMPEGMNGFDLTGDGIYDLFRDHDGTMYADNGDGYLGAGDTVLGKLSGSPTDGLSQIENQDLNGDGMPDLFRIDGGLVVGDNGDGVFGAGDIVLHNPRMDQQHAGGW